MIQRPSGEICGKKARGCEKGNGFCPAAVGNTQAIGGVTPRRLYGELYAVSYRVEGQSLVFDRPRLIGKVQSGTRSSQRNFDVHPDGQRFAVAPAEPAPSPTAQRNVVVVFNFLDEVKRLVPTAQR